MLTGPLHATRRNRRPLVFALCALACACLVTHARFVFGQDPVRVADPEPETAPETVETIPIATEPEQPPAAKDAVVLDTIVVTASKRPKAQRDLPGSVGVVNGAQLEDMRAQGMADYFKLIPGVTYADQGHEGSVPVIRGIATDLQFGFMAHTTGVYMDDMPFADPFFPGSMPDLNPFDLDRVELLKGPQGTLFGAGALAGAVRYLVHRPDHGVWGGKLMHTVSRTRLSEGVSPVTAAALNVPLFGDDLALRAVGVRRRQAGLYDMYAHDPNGNVLRHDKDADTLEESSGRLLASWNTPLDALKISAFYFDQERLAGDFSFSDNRRTPERDDSPFPDHRDFGFGGGNLLATYDFGWGELVSSTNRMTKEHYVLQHGEEGLGLDHQNQSEVYRLAAGDARGYTQELRLSSAERESRNPEWLLGASHLEYDHFDWEYLTAPQPVSPPPEDPDEVSQQERDASQLFGTIDSQATESALFGEGAFQLGQHWEITAGARYYKTHQIHDIVSRGAQVVAVLGTTEERRHYEEDQEGVNPKLALRYLHNRNLQWYSLVAKGFQFGGGQLNPPLTGIESAFVPYKSSTLWNYESGIRTEWLDRSLRFDVTFFYMDWKDLQQMTKVSNTVFDELIIVNVGRAHSEGAEAALEVIPFGALKLTSAAAWINARADEPIRTPDGEELPAGTRLPGTPHFQWANMLSYEHSMPHFSGWSFRTVLIHAWTGTAPDGLASTGEVGGYATLDARLSLTKVDSRFLPEIVVGINNLTDARGVTFQVTGNDSVDQETTTKAHFVQPRTALVSVSLRY